MSQHTPEEMMKTLLGKLYQVLTMGDSSVPRSTDNFIAWCAPGMPYSPQDLLFASRGLKGANAEETKNLFAQAFDFANLVNFVPDPSGIYSSKQQQTTYEQSGTTLANVYENVLQFSQVASGDLSDKEKEKLERFRKLLMTTKKEINILEDPEVEGDEYIEKVVPGPIVAAYEQKMAEYEAARTEYINKWLSAINSDSNMAVQDWGFNEGTYRMRVKAAMNAWVSQGYKNEYEQINAYIDQVTKRDLTLLKARLVDQFERGRMNNVKTNQPFYFTSFAPTDFANSTRGWTNFYFGEENYNSYDRSETNAWGGSAGVGFGLFGARASVSGQSTSKQFNLDTSRFKMSFMLTQVPIIRSWMSLEFLKNSAWRFSPNSGMSVLSDGQVPPKGQLVAYPTTAIFVRDVKIDCAEFHLATSEYNSEIKAGAKVSYGPFSVGGSYSRSVGERKVNSKFTPGGLEIEGLQLIGFKCHLLGRSPNPSTSIQEWA